MIDTHCHLNLPIFEEKLEEIIKNSRKSEVQAIIIASTNLFDSQKAISLAKQYPNFLLASAGIHPQKTDPENKMPTKEQLKKLELLVKENRKKIVAIGECGLDPTPVGPDEEARTNKEQKELFIGQMKIAAQADLPLIVHSRAANDEIIEIIKNFPEAGKLRGVFHCYSGGKKRIKIITGLAKEWYFGVDGNITYTPEIQEAVRLMPLDRVVLETDSPWLAPLPLRGKANEPANLIFIARKIAGIWNISEKEVISQTDKNAKELFDLSV